MAQGDPQGWESLGVNDPLLYKANLRLDRQTGSGQIKEGIRVVTNRDNGNYDVYRTGFLAADQKLFGYNASNGKIIIDQNNKAIFDQFFTGPRSQQLTNLNKSVRQATLKLAENNVSGGSSSASQAALDRLKKTPGYKPTTAPDPSTTPVDGAREFAESIVSSGETRKNFPQNLVYPVDLAQKQQDVIKFSMLEFEPRKLEIGNSNLGGFEKRRSIGNQPLDRKAIGVVVLPIPNGISDTNACNWGDGTMNPAEALLANLALTTIKSGFGAGALVAGSATSGLQENAGEIAQALAPAFAGLAAGQSGAQLLQRTEGAVFNPNLELLFNGPTLRPFNFTFKLASRSPKESETIRSIIRFFKQGMSPIRSQSNLFLKAPHTFQIQYLHRNEEHKFLNKFKECALQSFNVNYTPEGQYATFNDGAMVSYQITMQFQELEPVFNDDYTSLDQNNDTEIGF